MPPAEADAALLEAMARAALRAGEAAMQAREAALEVRHKADDSPVTGADLAAEAVALEILSVAAPDIPVVAEERVCAGDIPDTDGEFFLVDALDGTKEFIRGGDDFTANVALIRGGRPVMGAVAQPAAQILYGGGPEGAWRQQAGTRSAIRVRTADAGAVVAVASKSHRTPETDAYLARFAVADAVSIGSSLKFCLLAEGRADLYPRMGRTMEWDTAAGHAVLLAAGGLVHVLDAEGRQGAPLAYGKRNQPSDSDFANPFFVAAGDPALLRD